MTEVALFRSLLFVPGNSLRRIDKAATLDVDGVILDLEDSVPLAEKETARTMVRDALPRVRTLWRRVYVRTNVVTGELAPLDIEAVVRPGLDGICIPKVESAGHILLAEGFLADAERKHGLEVGSVTLLPIIETAKGVMNALEVASASPRVVGLLFGAEDFTLDMGITRTRRGRELFFARSQVVVAARAAGVAAVDTVYSDFRDREGLEQEAHLARHLGFVGKCLIHPDQLEIVNRMFSPSPEEIANAQKVVAAFQAAVAQGSAAVSVEGRMVDVAVAERAKKTLQIAQAVARATENY
ncbi:MAG: CoA ester lyase [Chloroflexi bacterium]|nr:CoA ester lyase [Chloroflexota bacterium]